MFGIPVIYWSVLVFLAGMILTALARAMALRWVARPRPELKVLHIGMGPRKGAEKTTIAIDYALLQRERSTPVVASLSSQMSIADLRRFCEKSLIGIENHKRVIDHLKGLLARPTVLDAGLSVEEQRRAIIREWSQYGTPLESLAHAALSYFDGEIPPLYKQPHPPEWKDPSRAVVHVDGTRDYNLREIDIDAELKSEVAVQGPVGIVDELRQKLSAMNIHRRFWIHLREQDIRWLFSKIVALGDEFMRNGFELVEEVKTIIEKESPSYVTVQAVLSNDGQRSLGLRSFGYLTIPLADQHAKEDVLVPVQLGEVAEPQMEDIQVVSGSTAVKIAYSSVLPVSQLVISDSANNVLLDGSRLRALYAAHVLDCRLVVALVGFGIDDSKALVSAPYKFGAPADSRTRERLSAAIETRLPGQRMSDSSRAMASRLQQTAPC